KHLDMNLTKAKFDELTHDLVEKTAEPVQRALSDAGLQASELSKVLLVGGSTRIPAVQDKVRQLTGHEPSKSLNPDECVALGASVQGGKLAGDAGAGDILLLDVTPLSLSIETMGGIATRLIERNTTIPTKKSQIFSTAADNQPSVEIHVLQGEREMAAGNKTLGRFTLDGIAPAPRGSPQIEVTFDIDANGIVNVSAKDLGTGKEQKITITASTNLSQDEIDKAMHEAEQYAEQDKKNKEAVEVRNNAEQLVFQSEKALTDLGDKLSADEKSGVQAEIEKVKEALKGTDTDMIKAATEGLSKKFSDLAGKIYQQQAPQGDPNMGGAQGAGAQGGQQGDFVDADFTEVKDDDNK
ncbi:MAG: Hsp70 family protein, partial [Butyricicoccus sp.]|nr:Hsp70 family protein [Butyricicoccus sp.]